MTWAGPMFGASAVLAIGAALVAALAPRPRDAVLALALCLLGTAGTCLAVGSGYVFLIIAAGLVIPVPAALLVAVLQAPPAEPDRRTGGRGWLGPACGAALFAVLAFMLGRAWPAGGGMPQTSPEWLGSRVLTDHSLTFLLSAAVLSLASFGAVALLRPRGSAALSLFTAAVLAAAALIAIGVMAMLRRRSLVGTVIGFEISLAGLMLLAVALLTLTGFESSLALVAAMVLAALAMASAVLVAAVHLSMARASGTERGLEPW